MRGLVKIERLKLIALIVIVAVMGALSVRVRVASSAIGTSSRHQATSPGQSIAPQSKPTPQPTPEGCVSCHTNIEPMHDNGTGKLDRGDRDGQNLTCTYCHGGNPAAKKQEDAHVRPRFPEEWKRDGKRTSANPERTLTLLSRESWEFVRFVNPADLRVARKTCGSCHAAEVSANETSMMRHGAMLWGAGLYNNGGFPEKDVRFGEAYTSETGAPARLLTIPQPTKEETLAKGWLPFLDPLPRWEISQPGNLLRVFERGGKGRFEVGLPNREEDPGKPDKGLSPRGLGTNNRTDPVYLGLQKTRLLDPTLNHLGTNDHPGDFRSSGCAACHVIYANDRSAVNSGSYARFGNTGTSASSDTQIPKGEPGHPIRHRLTNSIPTSQCMVCHMHPGTNMVATYTGMIWWDNETDGDKLYRTDQHTPSAEEEQDKLNRNPEAASLKGLWSERKFSDRLSADDFIVRVGEPFGAINQSFKRIHLADYHGHGWLFRAVFKRDRAGQLLDTDGKPVTDANADALGRAVAFSDEDNFELKNKSLAAGAPVHLKDIHLEKGMHCVDCHFRQDAHGTGILYNEPRAAIEITCEDCHGTIRERGKLVTSGFAAGQGVKDGKLIDEEKGRNLRAPRSGLKDITRNLYALDADGNKIPVFELAPAAGLKKTVRDASGREITVELKQGEIAQNSLVEPGRWWRVKQTMDTINPASRDYNELSRYAKTVRRDNQTWGDVPAGDAELAHSDKQMTCFACHSSWMTSCFGCHLSMQANRKMPNRHFEGEDSRNYTTYNYQVLRDDVYMLARDGTVTGNRVAPAASRSAILVSSQNQNREWIYSQQQTISAAGFSGQSFSTHVPHTVRAAETKGCSDCHVSQAGDNNAWMAQLLMQGTNFVNFMGRYAYVAADDALEAVVVTERDEPQAVIGSTLHKLAYPDDYKKFVDGGREMKTAYEHEGNPKVLQVQLRGEYAYVAAGSGGLRIYDVAQIDHKGFSERITTAPVSRFGQRFWVKTKYAAAVAAPSTLALDPARARLPENQEQPIHPLYGYLYVADREEGLILVSAATLLDGDPLNNYLQRALTWNPDGVLSGANNIQIAGTHAYVTTERALVVIDINDPLKPSVVRQIPLREPRAVAIQFRYCFVADADGLQVVDVTKPEEARLVEGATVRLNHARDVYVARTYAYVADGADGVAIIDVTKPEQPRLDQTFDAGGAMTDAHQVKVAMTNASLYAYVADGAGGLKVLQLTDPETMPTYAGFSPRPEPRLIATYHTKGAALAVSKGLDRDRAVDESGNQIAVFGRRGARPFNLTEQRRMYLLDGQPFAVSDAPATAARDFKVVTASLGNDNDGENGNAASVDKAAGTTLRVASANRFAPARTRAAAALGIAGLACGFFFFCWRGLRRMNKSGRRCHEAPERGDIK
ncbi:MAG: multiheme c-type cytochrome [Pyrinomonadaceae bacterium]